MNDTNGTTQHPMTLLWAAVNKAKGPLGVGARVARKLPVELLQRIGEGDEAALEEGRRKLGARQRRITRGADAIVRAVGEAPRQGEKRQRRGHAEPVRPNVAAWGGLQVVDHGPGLDPAARVLLLAIVELGSVKAAEEAFPRAIEALRRIST